jgi:hypothetical protein
MTRVSTALGTISVLNVVAFSGGRTKRGATRDRWF